MPVFNLYLVNTTNPSEHFMRFGVGEQTFILNYLSSLLNRVATEGHSNAARIARRQHRSPPPEYTINISWVSAPVPATDDAIVYFSHSIDRSIIRGLVGRSASADRQEDGSCTEVRNKIIAEVYVMVSGSSGRTHSPTMLATAAFHEFMHGRLQVWSGIAIGQQFDVHSDVSGYGSPIMTPHVWFGVRDDPDTPDRDESSSGPITTAEGGSVRLTDDIINRLYRSLSLRIPQYNDWQPR